jgi:hypothetical protein
MSKPIVTQPATASTATQNTPTATTATPRRRAYSPRVTGKTKDGLVKQKELELRDARMLTRLIKEVRNLSPWGLGKLKEMMQDMGPVQPDFIAWSAGVPPASLGVPPSDPKP